MFCPLCSSSGFTFHQLCLHLSSAHPGSGGGGGAGAPSPDHAEAEDGSGAEDVPDRRGSAGKPAPFTSALEEGGERSQHEGEEEPGGGLTRSLFTFVFSKKT